jgi:23S rRNA (guanosine2251-2'-O)-methyltransferase
MSDTQQHQAVLAGRNPVREMLEREPSRVERLHVTSERGSLSQLVGMARASGVSVQFVPQKRLDALAPGVNHQGVVALVSAVTYVDADALFAQIAPTLDDVKATTPLLLALDGLEDPFNVGAILRTAAAAGVAGVLVSSKGAAPIGATALKASAGTALTLPIARVEKMAAMLEAAKERGYWIVGAEGESETAHTAWDWARATILVIGSEKGGMSRSVASACDGHVSIPMPGAVESLNASVAAGVLLFEAVRQRTSTTA